VGRVPLTDPAENPDAWVMVTQAFLDLDADAIVQGIVPPWERVFSIAQASKGAPLTQEDKEFIREVAYPLHVTQMQAEYNTLLRMVAQVADPTAALCPCGATGWSVKPRYNTEEYVWELKCLLCNRVGARVDAELNVTGVGRKVWGGSA
jgi:hypothetical protein